ncbi:MAG: hypothetical protein RLY16_1758 [Bacteroidota bacterium]
MENEYPLLLCKTILMANIETTNRSANAGKKKAHRFIHVDLTPMVDLGFLLITFFVFTSAISKPRVMPLLVPNDREDTKDIICASCTLTLIPDGENGLFYYQGLPTKDNMFHTNFSVSTIRQIIMKQQQHLLQLGDINKQLVMVIKPTDAASYQQFIDLTDEAAINLVKRYYIDEVTPEELNLLNQKFAASLPAKKVG